jgi:hypothetical protein
MSQQARKQQESVVVRRLTAGVGAAALGLAWYFTASATSSVPVAFGAQPAADEQPVVGIEQLDDHVFVRTVHVPAPRPPAGGVKAGTAASGGQTATSTAAARTSGGTTAATGNAPAAQAATSSAPVAQPVPVAVPAAPAPTPKPVATTGGSTPAK